MRAVEIETEASAFADHGATTDAADFLRDMAGTEAIGHHAAQNVGFFIGPRIHDALTRL